MNADEELPEGWTQTTLGDVMAQGEYGTSIRCDYEAGGTPVLRIPNIAGEWLTLDDLKYATAPLGYKEGDYLRPGDMLMCRTNGSISLIGKTALVRQPFDRPTAFASYLLRFRFVEELVLPLWVHLFQCSPEAREFIERNAASSAGQHNISLSLMRTLPLPIAPLAEQWRIVAAVEALLSKVSTARDRLNRVPAILKRFRQSVLSAACSGRLTADWRERNPSDDNWAAPEDTPEVPESWQWSTLKAIAEVKGGVTKGRKIAPADQIQLPYLRVANVQDGYLDLKEIKHITAIVGDRKKYALQSGDILFIEGGNREHLGRGAVWRGEIAGCIHQNHIFRARLERNDILSDFVSIATKSSHARDYFFANASQTVNLASINLRTLAALPIPLPPLAEQQEIVRRVDALFALADRIEAKVSAAKRRVDALTQAVLAKAFRGELVPTEAELARREYRPYEPAADLLARIRADREQAAPPAKPTRRPRRKPVQ